MLILIILGWILSGMVFPALMMCEQLYGERRDLTVIDIGRVLPIIILGPITLVLLIVVICGCGIANLIDHLKSKLPPITSIVIVRAKKDEI